MKWYKPGSSFTKSLAVMGSLKRETNVKALFATTDTDYTGPFFTKEITKANVRGRYKNRYEQTLRQSL